MKRCKPCALQAHGQTGNGYAARNCIACGAQYKPTGSHQKACQECRPQYVAERNKAALAELRRKANATPVGTILMCATCGDDFEYKAGPQTRCPACQRAHEVKRIHDWLASDKKRLKKYTDKSRDNYFFGGNREAALARDQHTCQHCGSKDDLHVHHIDGRGTTTHKDFRNNALENLLTLCRGCHTRVHAAQRHSNCAPQMKTPL